MDRAPLRPVAGRPSGPVSDAEAARQLAAALPTANERGRLALGFVVLAQRPRAEVAPRLGLDEDGLSRVIAGARKELRLTLTALPGSGWCELAERLISDRLDGALDERSSVRLDVHLRNCPRCVEHERKLVQATDALVAGVAVPPGPPELAPVDEPASAEPDAEGREDAESPPAEGMGARRARSLREIAVAASWNVLLAIAILLALASLALTVAGVLGADL